MNTSPPSHATITLQPSGLQFPILENQTVLEASLMAGATLPYGCTNGSCGECRAKVLSGEIRRVKTHDYTLTQSQKLDGQCLLCSYTAETDLEIDVLQSTRPADIPVQEVQTKLYRTETLDNISIITLKLSRGKSLRFLPGQSATLSYRQAEHLSLPIASCPCNAQFLEFHVNEEGNPEKPESNNVSETAPAHSQASPNSQASPISQFTDVCIGTRISVSGPFGTFTLSEAHKSPRIFFARGLEFNRIQGMVEQVISIDNDTPTYLIWQCTDTVSHYRLNLCRSWQDAIDEFTFVALENNLTPDTTAIEVLLAIYQRYAGECEVYLGGLHENLYTLLLTAGVSASTLYRPQL